MPSNYRDSARLKDLESKTNADAVGGVITFRQAIASFDAVNRDDSNDLIIEVDVIDTNTQAEVVARFVIPTDLKGALLQYTPISDLQNNPKNFINSVRVSGSTSYVITGQVEL